MPRTELYFWQDARGKTPVLEELLRLRARDGRAYARCRARLELLEAHGRDLNRPFADAVAEGIRELRVRVGNRQYRVLYFFDEVQRHVVILAHFFQKEDAAVPKAELRRALDRMEAVLRDRETHIRRTDWHEEAPRDDEEND